MFFPFFPCFFASQTVSGRVSVRSLEWSTSEFGDFLEELGDLSWSPPQGMVMFGCLAPWCP